ncbi:MAG: PleD family two-component system response regulator [Robiginitomaculum sp.]|nr:PleD family two-component system response regulator [Robiginitomaculum sp.]
MTGRILVVDDMEPNVRVLRAKLEAEYYEVLTAMSGEEAIRAAREQQPALILLDVMMPIMDGFETCRRLKNDPITQHIPVVMVTALDQQKDRVDGLQAGADDFLSKPINDVALFARVRSLLRLNSVMDELRSRGASGRGSGGVPKLQTLPENSGGRVLIVEENQRFGQRVARKLGAPYQCKIVSDQRVAAELAAQGFDLLLINLATTEFDGLRLCARVRANETSRHLPILGMLNSDDKEHAARALDIGVNDILERPVEAGELRARVHTLLQRRFFTEQLRTSLDQSLELAFTDQLTGLFNRRHMDQKLEELCKRAQFEDEASVVMIADIDHFKRVNDTWGHQAGDQILHAIATQLKNSFRAIDIVCRFGGEEFVVLMPGADLASAKAAADRFRLNIEQTPFAIGQGMKPVHITISGGLARIHGSDKGNETLARADAALYHAKKKGRNRMVTATKQSAMKKAMGQN